MGCPTGLVTAVAAVFKSPGALLTPAPKIALFGRIPRAGGVNGPFYIAFRGRHNHMSLPIK